MNLTDLFDSKTKRRLDINESGIPGNVPVEKIPGKQDLLKGRGRSYYEDQKTSGDDWYDDEEQETDLRSGDYVRDQQDGESGEVFRMQGDPYERRVRILDRDGRGWYIEPTRLTRVDPTDPDVQRYFGKKRVRDMDEDQWDSGEDVTVAQGDQSTTYQYKGCKFVVSGEEAQGEAWWYEPGDTWREADHYNYVRDESKGIDRFYNEGGQNVFNLSATNQRKVEQWVKAKAKDFVSTMVAQPNLPRMNEQGVAEGSLEELANTSLDVKEPKGMYNVNDRKQTTYKVFKFKSGKNTFLINFTVKGAPAFGKKQNWNAVNVAFGVKEKQDDYSFGDEIDTDLTARNKNQFLIYSTVINTIRRFITEYNTEIDEIIMQGAGERQEAMYQRFFQSAGKYFPGWHHDGKHSLVRDVPRQTGKKVKEQGVAEAGRYGSRNPDLMSAGDYDRYQQDQMDFDRRDFKRREHEAEWEQEKAYSEKLAARDAGTWYIRINGKILKDKQGQPYTFRGKAAANRAAVTMMAKPFNTGKEFLLTTSAADKI